MAGRVQYSKRRTVSVFMSINVIMVLCDSLNVYDRGIDKMVW
jgi:hypothetical protein